MVNRLACILVSAVMGLSGACASHHAASTSGDVARVVAHSKPQELNVGEDYLGGLWKTGPTYVSGQPTEEALQELPSLGVRAVISIRTPAEMDNRERVPFEEKEVVESLGLVYVNIPTNSSDYAYSPKQLKQFAEVMDEFDGEVLLHCTVGGRASHLWAAYAHRYGGLSVNEAWERGKAMNIGPPPMERFLGTTFELQDD